MSDKYPGGFVTTGAPAGYSVVFDGTGDYLTAASSSNLTIGTGDFTIEAWIYPISWAGNSTIVAGNGSINSPLFAQVTSTALGFAVEGVGWLITDGALPTLNTWSHVAVTRSGTTVKIFINGVQSGSTVTSSANFSNPIRTIGTKNGSIDFFVGYISNVRVLKGTALYTTTFTPPTQMFPVTNTQLLTCQSPTIIDNSTNALAITVAGDAKVSNFTPFAGYTGFNPALGAAAGGVWTLDEAAYYQGTRKWPIYDPYFNQTTLMLHGNYRGTVDSTGTPVYQNNTFLDSSVNNFTITRNGNTTQGTFTPFSQTGWSMYLPGANSSYVQTPSSTTTALLGGSLTSLGSLSFTIECFINTPGNIFLVGACDPGGGTADMILSIGSDGTLSFGATFSGYTTRTSTGAAPLNTWCHVAWVVTGSYVYFYVNGAPAGSATVGNTAASYGQLIFGGYNNSFTSKQYISNFRITKSAIYTGAFTPPTTNLTATTNTTLLAFQGNNFADNSANNYTLIRNGTPSIQAFSPFVPAYITPTTYSNWFDGTGDYLSSSSANYTATGDFTVEAWFYTYSNPSFGGIISTRNSTGTNGFNINLDSSQKIRFFINNNDFPAGYVSYNLNQWYHVALVRSGSGSNNVTAYVNGISVGSVTNTASTVTSDLVLGRFYTELDNYYLNGVISNARFVNGTALYTANFTPPNAPFPTGTTNQQLLTCQASTMIDSNTYTTAKTITANGNVRPVASPTPFPAKVDTTTLNSAYSTSLIGGSAYFDGSGDSLSLSSTSLNLGSSDFTIETWVYATTTERDCIIGSISDSAGLSAWMLMINESGSPYRFYCRYNGGTVLNYLVGSGNFPVNQWTHFAVTRNGANLRIFSNGVQVGTTNTSLSTFAIDNASTNYYFGRTTDDTANFTGYLSGTRILVGTALYTQNFAPPLTPPTAITNTRLLTNFTNAGIFDNTAKNVLETVSTAQISTAQSKYGGSSMFFNGSGNALKAPYIPSMDFGTGDFTIECWVYTTNTSPGYSQTVLARHGSTGGTIWIIQILNGGTSRIVLSGSVVCAGTTVAANTWTHIAFTRSGTSLRAFNNGVLFQTVTDSTSLSGTQILSVGAQSDVAESFIGYIDDVRITKGVARYTTNFTPPTSQLQDQ